jgi:hypothetical protein
MEPVQQHSDAQMVLTDSEEIPAQYRARNSPSGPGRERRPPRRENTNNKSLRTDQNMQTPSRSHDATRKVDHQATPPNASVKHSPGIWRRISRWLPTGQQTPQPAPSPGDQQEHEIDVGTRDYVKENEEYKESNRHTPSLQNDIMEVKRNFENILHQKEQLWMGREMELQQELSQAHQRAEERDRIIQTQMHKVISEKATLQEQFDTFIRKHQEASFAKMESARWLPVDEIKVMHDLDRLKMDMRTWAKSTSIKDISILKSLGKGEYAALMERLSNVAVFENGKFPDRMFTTAKSTALLLNALLADDIYSNFFQTPFFFLAHNHSRFLSKDQSDNILESIYHHAKIGK